MSPAVIGDVEERSGRGCDHPDPQPARDREPAGAVRDEDIDEIEASVSCRAAVTADAPQSARDVVDVTCGHRDAVEGAGALRDDPDLCLRADYRADDDVAVLVDADRGRVDRGLHGRAAVT